MTDLNSLLNAASKLKSTDRMPALFLGHGNPMNVITDNEFKVKWQEVGRNLPRPAAIAVVSAHWLTDGTAVTINPQPKTIHDFYGFPEELYKQIYPAPGAADYANLTIENVKSVSIAAASDWGLDHGAWTVLVHLFPKADIPVYQISIDYHKHPEYHYNLAKELSFLREKGVMVIASGNLVHNLRMVNWSENPEPYPWALEFDEFVKNSLMNNDSTALVEYKSRGRLADMAHPTNDHYLPLIYAQGVRSEKDELAFFTDVIDMGSVSMRSFILCD